VRRARHREAGHAFVWMLMAVLMLIAAAMGAASMGGATGDYVRRQVSADAAGKSAADVVAERMRHIGRLQEIGLEAQDERDQEVEQMNQEIELAEAAEAAGEVEEAAQHWDAAQEHYEKAQEAEEKARKASEAAVQIAENAPENARREAERVARANGASPEKVAGMPGSSLPNAWFGVRPAPAYFGAPLKWVTLGAGFSKMKIDVAVRQAGVDGASRRAHAVTAVASRSRATGGGPITTDDWYGRLTAP